MTAQAPDLAAVVARLESVERQNRQLKLAGFVVLVLAAASLLMGQTLPRSRVVEAERFVLKDAAGKEFAELGMLAPDSPSLQLLDKDGKLRAVLSVFPNGMIGLGLGDTDGKPGINLQVEPSGSARLDIGGERYRANLVVGPDGSALALGDKDMKGSVSLSSTLGNYLGGLEVTDIDGNSRAKLGLKNDGTPVLFLTDKQTKGGIILDMKPDGSAAMAITHENRKSRAALGVLPDGTPFLGLGDKDGKLRWKAP